MKCLEKWQLQQLQEDLLAQYFNQKQFDFFPGPESRAHLLVWNRRRLRLL